MTEYEPQYKILERREMLPREQIRLVPEETLKPFMRAELANLRRGVGYKTVCANTPENRESIAVRTAYFQMVAHKEGWRFDPNNYQVYFVAPRSEVLGERGSQKRIYNLKDEAPLGELEEAIFNPKTGRVGFESQDDETFERMEDEKTEGLFSKIIKMFG